MSKTNLEFSEAFMALYGATVNQALDDRWTWKKLLWALDWRSRHKLTDIREWLKEQIDLAPDELIEKANSYRQYSNDKKIIYILRWVSSNYYWKSDWDNFKTPELWLKADESFDQDSFDCEDGAILIYVLAKLAGVPDYLLRIRAGLVFNGKEWVGHAYLIYKPEFAASLENDDWVAIDWCWYYDNKHLGNRSRLNELNQYGDVWFEVNSSKSYGRYKLK